MNGFIRLLIRRPLGAVLAPVVLSFLISSCASQPVEDDMGFEGDDGAEVSDAMEPADGESASAEDFSDFEESSVDEAPQVAEASPEGDPSLSEEPIGDQDLAIEQDAAPAPEAGGEDPFAADVADVPAPDVPAEPQSDFAQDLPVDAPQDPAQDIAQDTPQDIVQETVPTEVPVTETPATEQMADVGADPARITDLQFKANDSGGTVIVQGNRPLTFTTRTNPDLNQFIVEVNNATLPDRLKRSLNTKDIKGSVGAIDAYQNPGSTTARFVIQLRDGVGEPAVQAEGNSLLIVANGQGRGSEMSEDPVASATGGDGGNASILPAADLTGFLSGNTKFYGKKISVETSNIDIRDALSLITEESGVNMVIAEEVKGPISLKLRQVPWDQALVVIMKAKKLGYSRQGNVLRIAPLADLKTEEEDATKLAQSRRNIEPLKVRMFPVSYARVEDLEKKIKDFLGERGRVVGDVRTNVLVVTDIEENIERAAKLISNLDMQPAQVLIEGKIVEAQESFTRNIGVNWGSSGSPIELSKTSRGPLNLRPSFSINPTAAEGAGSANMNFNLLLGTMDVFGTLNAALALSEREDKIKIISSPRIMTLTNEVASINQVTEVPVRQITQTPTGTQETFQFKPLTLKLEVTPQVTADGSVIMKVNVGRQFQGSDVSTAGTGAFSVNSREANTRVLVRNGQTAVIGGIYQSDASDGESGVPWLRELPVISYLFKTKNLSKAKSELLIFLTPRIVGQVDSSPVSTSNSEDF